MLKHIFSLYIHVWYTHILYFIRFPIFLFFNSFFLVYVSLLIWVSLCLWESLCFIYQSRTWHVRLYPTWHSLYPLGFVSVCFSLLKNCSATVNLTIVFFHIDREGVYTRSKASLTDWGSYLKFPVWCSLKELLMMCTMFSKLLMM